MATIIPNVPLYGGEVPLIGQGEAEFSQNAQDSLVFQADLPPNLNATIASLNTANQEVEDNAASAAESAAIAQTNANFAGEWSALTGALNVPATVLHNGEYWQLLNDLADVTASEPGVTADYNLLGNSANLKYNTIADIEAASIPAGNLATVKWVDAVGKVGAGVFETITAAEATARGLALGYTITDGIFSGEAFSIANGNVAVVADDMFGFQNALLNAAAVVPDGSPDSVGDSKVLQALFNTISGRSITHFNTVSDMKAGVTMGGVIIEQHAFTVGQRVSVDLTQWEIVLSTSPEYGIDLDDGVHKAVLDCGFITLEAWGADPTGAAITDTTMDEALDFLRKRPPLAGSNFNLTYGSRGVIIMRGDAKYRRSTPWLFEEDVVSGLYSTGITVVPNGATIVADPSFTGVTRIKNTSLDTVVVNSAIIVGVKDYATQSGHYVSFVRIDDLNVDGSGVLESALYEDVASNNSYDNWQVSNCDYGLTGKVTFLSSYKDWNLHDCNGTISFSNTSVNDGYNSGNGLEGGGVTFGGWTITGDNGSAQPRLYMNKIGEFKFTSFTSYQGLGDGIVIERDPSDSPTGSRWNQLGRVEIGDLAGKPLVLTNLSFVQCTDFIIVKDGLEVPLDSSLMSITGCGDITLRGFDIDQFYDFDPDLSWGPVLDVTDSARIKIEVNNARSIPSSDNAYSMFRFRGNSQTCEVILGTLTQAVGPRLYQSPVSSEATCVNIKVKGITTQAGAYVSAIPDLNGAGDSWDEITPEFGKSPISGLKSRVALTADRDGVETFEIASIRKAVTDNTLTDICDINFNGATLHNAIIDVDLVVSGDSGYASRTERRKFLFNRTPASAGVTSSVELTAEELSFSASANYTVDAFTTSDVTSQFQVKIQALADFGGTIGDTTGVVSGTVTVRSKDDFDVSKL